MTTTTKNNAELYNYIAINTGADLPAGLKRDTLCDIYTALVKDSFEFAISATRPDVTVKLKEIAAIIAGNADMMDAAANWLCAKAEELSGDTFGATLDNIPADKLPRLYADFGEFIKSL